MKQIEINTSNVLKIKDEFLKWCNDKNIKADQNNFNIFLTLQTDLENVDNWSDDELLTFHHLKQSCFYGSPILIFNE